MVKPNESLMRRGWNSIKKTAAMPFSSWGGTGGVSTGYGYAIDDTIVNGVWRAIRRFSGTNIDYAQEVGDLLNHSIVMAAVNWVARALPEAPLNVVKIENDGTETIIPRHPAATIFKKPNPFYSGSTLWKAFAASWITSGNVYYIKARQRGKTSQLWFAPPSWMEPRWPLDGSEYISHFQYRVDGVPYEIEPEDVIHFKDGIDPNNLRLGISPCASLLREIYGDAQASNYQAALLSSGAVPPVIITPKDDKTDYEPKEIKENYLRATQGDERGKAFVSNFAIDVNKIAFSPTEMDLQPLRKFPEQRFAAVIGIPAVVLGFETEGNSTYNNNEQAGERAYENYMIPLWRYLEEELNLNVLPEFDSSDRVSFRFDLSKVRALSQDEDALFKRLSLGYKAGWIKRAEARSKAGFNTGPDDDVYETDVQMAQKAEMADLAHQRAMEQLAAAPQPQLTAGQPEERPKAKAQAQGVKLADKLPLEHLKRSSEYSYSAIIGELPLNLSLLVKMASAALPADEVVAVEDNPHVTLIYGLHTADATAAVEALRRELLLKPAEVSLDKVGMFIGDDGNVLYVTAVSPDLEAMNAALADQLDCTKTQQDYLPHVTIAYLKAGCGANLVGSSFMAGRKFTVDTAIFSDANGNRTQINLRDGRAIAFPSTKASDRKPPEREIDRAEATWRDRAPEAAADLLSATEE